MRRLLNAVLGRAQGWCAKSRLGTRLAVRIRNQAQAVLAARMGGSHLIAESGEQRVIDAYAPHASSFVDVGANVGHWTLAFADKCARPARGFVFDPSPVALRRLELAVQSLVDRGGLSLDISCRALADRPGTMTCHLEHDAGETTSLVPGFSAPEAVATAVAVSTLDEEFASRGLERVDMLKIDAEGFDGRVLFGGAGLLARQAAGVVQFEYNAPWARAGSTLCAALALLSDCGYEVFLLRKEGLYRFDYARYGDFFAYSNFVAIAPDRWHRLRPLVVGDI